MSEITHMLSDVTFNFEQEDGSCGPHIALTLPSQGGSASGMNGNKPYLFKADSVEVTPEIIKSLKDIGCDVSGLEKAMSFRGLQNELEQAITHKFKPEKEDCEDCCIHGVWVEDFNDSFAVFNCNVGLFAISYALGEDGEILLGDVAVPVVSTPSYTEVEGKPLKARMEGEHGGRDDEAIMAYIAEACKKEPVMKAINKIKEEIQQLPKAIAKTSELKTEAIETEVSASDVNVTKGKAPMTQEVEKEDLLKAADVEVMIAKAVEAAVQKAKEEEQAIAAAKLAEVEKAAQEARDVQAKTDIAEVVKGYTFVDLEKHAVLGDSLFDLQKAKPEGYAAVVDALEKAAEAIAKFATAEHGAEAAEADTKLQKAAQDKTAEILKARKEARQAAKSRK